MDAADWTLALREHEEGVDAMAEAANLINSEELHSGGEDDETSRMLAQDLVPQAQQPSKAAAIPQNAPNEPPSQQQVQANVHQRMFQHAIQMHEYHLQQAEVWGKVMLQLAKKTTQGEIHSAVPGPSSFAPLARLVGPAQNEQNQAATGEKIYGIDDVTGVDAVAGKKGQRGGDAAGGDKFLCGYNGCTKSFRFLSHLKNHARVHFAEKPYVCEYCQKRFRFRSGLNAHRRTHTKERPHRCPEESCGMSFPTKGALTVHMRRHTGDKPFKCTVEGCDRSFITKQRLVAHLNSHEGNKPFQCPWKDCEKSYYDKYGLQYHIKSVHENDKRFECMYPGCGKRFVTRCELNMHYGVHTGEGYAGGKFKKRRLSQAAGQHEVLGHEM